MKLAIIGAGNMGEALARGIIRAGLMAPRELVLTDVAAERVRSLADELGAVAETVNTVAMQDVSLVVLAVKPHLVQSVCREIAPAMPAGATALSLAAGITMQQIQTALGRVDIPVVRTMPNTPALVGMGAFGLSFGAGVTPEMRDTIIRLLSAIGIVEEVPEHLLDAITGLSGSGPAYVAVFIEALVDGGVLMGLPRAQAMRLAMQMVKGTAALLQETGQHPAQLKDLVSTPAGTTIAALEALEGAGFRHAVMSAVRAATERAHELSKE